MDTAKTPFWAKICGIICLIMGLPMVISFISTGKIPVQERTCHESFYTVEKAWSDKVEQSFLFASETKTKYFVRITADEKSYTVEVDGPYETGDKVLVEVTKESDKIVRIRESNIN